MPQTIDVPGQGLVEFPDGMSDDDIVKAIQANTPKQPADESSIGTSSLRGVIKGLSAVPAMLSDATLGIHSLAGFPPEKLPDDDSDAIMGRGMRFVERLMKRLGLPESRTKPQQFVESAMTGAAGGAMLGPVAGVGLVPSLVGGAVGGVAGETAKQLGAPVPVQIGAEIAGNVLATRTPKIGTKVERKLHEELAKEGKLPQTKATYEAAQKEGVDLNIAEASDSGRMAKAADRAISVKGDPSAIDEFNVKRQSQVGAAAKRFMEIVSPESGIEKAASAGRATSKKVMEAARAERQAAADPFFKKAFDGPSPVRVEFGPLPTPPVKPVSSILDQHGKRIAQPEPPPPVDTRAVRIYADPKRVSKETYRDLVELHDETGFKAFYKQAEASLAMASSKGSAGKRRGNYLTTLNEISDALGEHIRAANSGKETVVKNVTAKRAVEWKERVEKALLELSEKDPKTGRSYYEQANEVYKAHSPRVHQLEESAVGRLADTADIDLAAASKKFFNVKHGPVEVSKAFKALKTENPESADQFLRSYLEDLFNDAVEKAGKRPVESKTAKGLIGSDWIAKLTAGDAKSRHSDLLKASMSGKQYKAFLQLGETLRATGRAPMAGSDAKWISGAQQTSDVAQSAMKAADESLGRKRFVLDFLRNVVEGRANKEIAALMTDPKGVEKVLAAGKLPSQKREAAMVALIRSYATKEQEDGGQ